MPVPETLPPFFIDDPSQKVLKQLKKGKLASFYFFSNAQGTQAGLVAARATSKSTQKAAQDGNTYRKQMNVKRFCKGIILCETTGQITFVRYNGNLTGKNLARLTLRMGKKGGFTGPIARLLKSAEIQEKAELEAAEASLADRVAVMDATREPDDAEPGAVEDEHRSNADLLAELEEDFLSEESFRKDFEEITAEATAPIAAMMGLTLTDTAPEKVAELMVEGLSKITPAAFASMRDDPALKDASRAIFEAFSEGMQLGEAGAEPELRVLGKIRDLVALPLIQQLIEAHTPALETAISPRMLHFQSQRIEVLTTPTFSADARWQDAVPVERFKTASVKAIGHIGRDLRGDLREIEEMDPGESRESAESLMALLQKNRDETVASIEAVLESLKMRWPAMVIEEVTLHRLRETLGKVETVLHDTEDHIDLLELRSRISLTAPRKVTVAFFDRSYQLNVSDEGLEGVICRGPDGATQPVVEVTPEDIRDRISAPADALDAMLLEDEHSLEDIQVALAACIRDLESELRNMADTMDQLVLLRSAGVRSLEVATETVREVSRALERRLSARSDEHAAAPWVTPAALAELYSEQAPAEGEPSPDPLATHHARALASLIEALSSRTTYADLRVRLGPSPYPPVVWKKGGSHEASWKAAEGVLSRLGYGAKKKGRLLNIVDQGKKRFLRLEGDKATFVPLLGLIGQTPAKGFVLLVTDARVFNEQFAILKGIADGSKASMRKAGGIGTKRTAEEVNAAARGARRAVQDVASSVEEICREFLPTGAELEAERRRRASQLSTKEKNQQQRTFAVEVLMEDPRTREPFLNHINKEFGVENIMFYVAVQPGMAAHRALFPALLASEGLSGIPRTRWLYETFIHLDGPCTLNVRAAFRTPLELRYEQELLGPSPMREYIAALQEVRGLLKDVLSRFNKPAA